MADTATAPDQTFTPIVDSLQDPDLDPNAALAGAKQSFTQAEAFVTDKLQAPGQQLQGTVTGLKDSLISGLTPVSGELPSLGDLTGSLGNLPISAEEISLRVTQKIDDVRQALNADAIAQRLGDSFPNDLGKSLIPTGDGGLKDAFQLPTDFTSSIKSQLDSLFGGVVSQLEEIGDDASTLPWRLLDNALSVLKNFLARLQSNDWTSNLKQLVSQEFFLPLQRLKQRIPHVALQEVSREIQRREQIIRDYMALLENYRLDSIQAQKAAALRKQIRADRQRIRGWKLELEQSEQRLRTLLEIGTEFDLKTLIDDISAALPNQVANSATADKTLYERLFGPVDALISSFTEHLQNIVEQVGKAIDKVKELLGKVIQQATEIGEKISTALEEKIGDAKALLSQIQTFLNQKLAQVTEFVAQAGDTLSNSIIPFKTSVNQFTGRAVAKILDLSQQIEDKTKEFETSLKQVNGQIETKLNPAALQQQLEPILKQVEAVLQGATVKKALSQAEQGITDINKQLQNISLKPVFKAVKEKTKTLETDISDYIKKPELSTAQKTAIKVGAKVIQQVDVPGQVKPELVDAFGEILSPVEGTISLVQAEVNKVDDIINGFEPQPLIEKALSGPIASLVSQLEAYRPAVLFAPLASGFETVIDSLKSLDPEQIIEILHQVHQRLKDLVSYLNPASFIEGLRQKVADVISTLPDADGLQEWLRPVLAMITDRLKDTKTLLQGLGLDDFISQANDGFLKSFQTIADRQISPTRIDQIKQQLAEFVPVADYAQEMASLALALEAFHNSPSDTVDLAIGNLNLTLIAYQATAQALEDQWQTFKDRQTIETSGDGTAPASATTLRSAMPLACQLAYDYLLVELFEKLPSDSALTSSDYVQSKPLQQYLTRDAIKTRLAASNLLSLKSDSLQVELRGALTVKPADNPASEEFKTLIENLEGQATAKSMWDATFSYLDQQLFDPLKATLDKLSSLWGEEGVKGLLTKIQAFFEYVDLSDRAAPATEPRFLNEIEELIKEVTDQVADQVGAILAAVKTSVGDFQTQILGNGTNQGVIEIIYEKIKAVVSQFDPYRILNSFYGVTDFYGDTLALLQLLQTASLEPSPTDQKQQIAGLILRHMRQLPQAALPATVGDTAAVLVEKHITARTPDSDKYLMLLLNALLSSPAAGESLRRDLGNQTIEFPIWLREEMDQLNSDLKTLQSGEARQTAILRYNRLCLETVFSQEISMGIQSVFPFFLHQLRKLYPKALEEQLGKIYQSILDVISSFPTVVAKAVQALYDQVKEAYQPISELKDRFFKMLLSQLYRLQTELEMGLDDLGEDYNQLLNVMESAG